MAPILLTGGSGKTASRLATRLEAAGVAVRRTSRDPKHAQTVRFDWTRPDGFGEALDGVRAVYLVAPSGTATPLDAMTPFLRRALATGVRRFVLLSAAALPEGGPMMGQVHAFLRQEAPEWGVLRPSWFMQNFSEAQHLPTIRDDGAVYTAAGDGRVAFVDAGDIAAAAAALLLAPASTDRDHVLTGPRALSYAEACAIIGEAADRRVTHHPLEEAQLRARLEQGGLPPGYAATLAAMDTEIAAGSEDRVTDEVERLTGHPPTSFEAFAAENRAAWR